MFLDELGELPLSLQAKLLRVLQTGEFERVGGTKTLTTDVRLVAATNRDLESEVAGGKFRADLFYRLNTFPIRLPALRDRKEDIPILAEHFVQKHSTRIGKDIDTISARMLKELDSYAWPGNVRELESTIERAIICTECSSVLELPGPLSLITSLHQSKDDFATNGDLLSVERSYILEVLEQTRWKIAGPGGASSVLGIPASTLRSKMKRFGITRPVGS